MRFNLTLKLVLAFTLVAAVSAGSGYYILNRQALMQATYEESALRAALANADASSIEAGVLRKAAALSAFLVTADPQLHVGFDEADRWTAAKVQSLLQQAGSAENEAAAKRLNRLNDNYTLVAKRIFSLVNAGKIEDAVMLYKLEARGFELETSQLAQDLNARLSTEAEKASQDASAQAAAARTAGYGAMLGTLGLGILLGMLRARSISRPVAMVSGLARRLARGDLSVESLGVKSRDEVGDMAAAVNDMAGNLRQVMVAVAGDASTVRNAAEALSAAAGQSAGASQDAARAVAQVAEGTNAQAAAAVEIQRTMDELQRTIRQIAAGASNSAAEVSRASGLLHSMVILLEGSVADVRGIAGEAVQAAQAARSGTENVGRAIEGLGRIREAVSGSAAHMGELERLSQQVGEIT
ncbi:MAG TPA: methyl-accepting chemotaxis protein, partial [Symbiobacteriaceae bacterium]|nr:methyl-accepting chemotaxis protein [Symbiobacteriaceae bacterium]